MASQPTSLPVSCIWPANTPSDKLPTLPQFRSWGCPSFTSIHKWHLSDGQVASQLQLPSQPAIWPNVNLILHLHLTKCQSGPTSHLGGTSDHMSTWPYIFIWKISTWPDPKSHLGGHIWPNVDLILHLIWPNVKVVLHLILGGHLITCQPDSTSSSNQISTWLDLKPHLGEHIWQNVNLILCFHLIKYQSDLTQSLILDGTSDQVSTWPYILFDQMSNWPYISYLGVHLIKWWPDPTSSSDQILNRPYSKPHTGGHIWPNINLTLHLIWPNVKVVLHHHLGFDSWSNVILTLHLHLTKYQSDLIQSLILDGTSDQMSTWPYISSDQMSNWSTVSSLGVHLTKCLPNPTSDLTKCQSGPTSHLQEYIWSNDNLTLHLHLTKYQPDLT